MEEWRKKNLINALSRRSSMGVEHITEKFVLAVMETNPAWDLFFLTFSTEVLVSVSRSLL